MFTFLVYASLTVNGVVLDCSQWTQNGDGSWSAASANLYAGRRIIEGRRFDSLKFGDQKILERDIYGLVQAACGPSGQ